MKKIYQTPSTQVYSINLQTLLQSSMAVDKNSENAVESYEILTRENSFGNIWGD